MVNLGLPPDDHTRHRTNGQFPRWVDRLPDDERTQMEQPGETVLNAVASEDTFALEDLDLKAFGQAGGSLQGTSLESLVSG